MKGQQTECVSVGNIKSFVPYLVVQINYSLMSLWFTFHCIVLSNQKHSCSVCEPSEDMVLCVTFDLLLCEYYIVVWSKSNICDIFSVTKTLSYYIYQKSMSVCCKLYFQYLHIKKYLEKQNIAQSCLREFYTTKYVVTGLLSYYSL